MAPATIPRLRATPAIKAITLTQRDLADELSRIQGPVTGEAATNMFDSLAQKLGWAEFHSPSSTAVQISEASRGSESGVKSGKRKAVDDLNADGTAGQPDLLGRVARHRCAKRPMKASLRHSNEMIDPILLVTEPEVSRCFRALRSARDQLASVRSMGLAVADVIRGVLHAQTDQPLVAAKPDAHRDSSLDELANNQPDFPLSKITEDGIAAEDTHAFIHAVACSVFMSLYRLGRTHRVDDPVYPWFRMSLEKAVMMALLPKTQAEEEAHLQALIQQVGASEYTAQRLGRWQRNAKRLRNNPTIKELITNNDLVQCVFERTGVIPRRRF